MGIAEIARRRVTSLDEANILQLPDSGIFDDPDSMQETYVHQSDLAQEITDLAETTRNAMNQLPVMSTVHLFETENSIVHYTSSAGVSLYIFPRLVNHNDSDREIRPAFISDGFSEMPRENLYLYICDSFSLEEQWELLQEILRWYQANLLSLGSNGNRRICQCVSDLCRELQWLLSSEARE